MPNSAAQVFLPALQTFAADTTSKFAQQLKANPEDQLKGPISAAIKAAGVALGGMKVEVVTEIQVAELHGRPDMGVTVGGLLAGYVELKAPGKGANPEKLKGEDKIQWEKFKNLPNLIYTDGNEWALYRSGALVGKRIRLAGDVTEDGAAAVSAENAAALTEIFRDFLGWQPITPTTPRGLADLLAPLCRLLREEVVAALKNPASSLSSLANDWRAYFFPQADDPQFADAYAQTFTYALLLARVSGASDLSITQAVKTIRPGHRLLADTLKTLDNQDARDEIAVPLNLLERVITAVDARMFTQQIGDPWLYFYEDFLAAYDPKMRNDRGVYYTPLEVVRCQVRLVAELLADRFDKEFSFVDEDVITLDPATGTGTYILAAMQHGLDQIAAVKGKGKRASAATTAAQNMHAFELLVGPYAVAHLRLTQQVVAEGGTLPADGVHVYLADTLESPNAKPKDYLPLPYKQFGEEQQRAQKIKRDTAVLVCIGNPPYDRQTIDPDDPSQQRKGGWVRFGDPVQGKAKPPALLDDFLAPLQASGQGVHAKNLFNDYVYFWRWALWKICEQQPGYGIISFITAASYLRGPGFAGMRELMRRSFDELWIIDLEGDNLGARKSENVFAIQTPVAIALGIRNGPARPDTPATVRYARITGNRAEKLASLDAVTQMADLPWRTCFSGWADLFLPSSDTPYWGWPLLTDLFPWQANGMQFKRSWPIGESKEVIERRWSVFLSATNRRASFKESRDRVITGRYPALDGSGSRDLALDSLKPGDAIPSLHQVAFRSFDRQWALVDSRIGDYLRPVLHQTHGDQQIYLTSLLTEVFGHGPAAVATALMPDLHHFRGSFGGAHVIPLWRDSAATKANITAGVLERLAADYGYAVTPQRFLAYAYAILASPGYVTRFWEELTIPGPRLPITRDADLFTAAANLGERLIWLHTYGERYAPSGKLPPGRARIEVGVPQREADYPEDFAYDAHKQELRVGKGLFSGVRPELWAFSISGLDVVKSWLGYRMRNRSGKSSSPLDAIRPAAWQFDDELLDLLWLLDHTVDLLPEIDALLGQILAGELWTAGDMPTPSEAERKGPKPKGDALNQSMFVETEAHDAQEL
ncbi:MAG: type ISP restriction/modification enzyme [Chloroflexales bacterium]